MNLVKKILLLGISLAVIAVGVFAYNFNKFLTTEISVGPSGMPFVVEPGSSFGKISNELAEQGVISNPDYFGWYARLKDKAAAVHAGEFQFEAGMTPVQLLEVLVSGDVRLYSFTIVEGWTFREVLSALHQTDDIVQTMVHEDWPALLESLNAELAHPEGLFLPETYSFPRGTTDRDLLQQAYDLMQETLANEWEGRAVGLPYQSPYEALTMASIIERETALASERARIAGVFVRRLQQGMRLQTDPTVIYGIGESFNGNLTRTDLRTDTPYNTYTRGGLPPSPIAMPGAAAINAALHPLDGTELFFVATGLGDGSHKFSTTKDEHDAAVQEYLRRQRASRNQ